MTATHSALSALGDRPGVQPHLTPVIDRIADRRRRLRWVFVSLVLLAGLAVASQLGRRLVVMNPTESVDPGLYLRSGGDVAVGRLVSLRLPPTAATYFAGRAGRPVSDATDWWLIKPVAAGPGDVVDTTGDRVLVNGRDLGPIYRADANGRALPSWRHRRALGPGEWLLVSLRSPASLDGRYFGPVRTADLECPRRPLLRWNPWRWGGTYVDAPPKEPSRPGG